MNLEQFTEMIVMKLQDYCGECVNVRAEDVLKYGGISYKGLYIQDGDNKPKPIFNLEEYYERYKGGKLSIEECMDEILDILGQHENMSEIEAFAGKLTEWDNVKSKVYPVLIPQKGNKELLKFLVSKELLDLAIIYVIRDSMNGCNSATVKVNRSLFLHYGISEEILHEQALHNLEKEEYGFYDLEEIAMHMLVEGELAVGSAVEKLNKGRLYVLRNESSLYGAAGILNKKILKEKVGEIDCYVIPSSIHELLFLSDSGERDKDEINAMIREVNKTVEVQDRLSEHCYFYHGATQELRMCA